MKLLAYTTLIATAVFAPSMGAAISGYSIGSDAVAERSALSTPALTNPAGGAVRAITTPGMTRGNTAGSPNRNFSPSQSSPDPEPGTLAMLLTGLGVMGSIARRRRLAKKTV